MLMQRDRSFLLVVDVQEKLIPAIHEQDRVVNNTAWLLGVAGVLEVPVQASEQYPKGLGHTIDELARLIPDGATTEKTHFSCAEAPACSAAFDALDRDQVIISGIEAHVCVLQTALGLKAAGRDVFVVADAVGSRSEQDAELALARMADAGVQLVTREMVAFEWLNQAGTPEFKRISKEYLR
jgi:nicotinamidase-related amidase